MVNKFLKIFAPLLILGAIWYQYQAVIRSNFAPVFNDIVSELNIFAGPCEEAIEYSLGAFDTKFGISQKYFLSALAEAEAVWEKPFGKELFTHTEAGILKVNLVYDYRQEATSKLASIGIEVKDTRASYDALKAKFTEMKAQFAMLENTYEKRVADFNARQKVYSDQVDYWNKRDGAPKKEYDALQTEQSLLKIEASTLESLRAQLNDKVEEINSMVVVLNRLINTLNISVDKYNTIGASRGESFEEGVYIEEGFNKQIEIYEFSSRAKLVRVLAHELGHALGLDHVSDPKAIMYSFNQGNNSSLTQADLDALNAKCEVK